MYSVEVIASKELTDVSIVVDDVIHTLTESETEEGKYTAELYAPVDAETYKIDVILKDELGLETKELGAGSISVKAKEVVVEQPKEEPKVELTAAEPKIEKEKDYSIKNLKVTELKTKSVLTWDAVEDVESYEIYKQIQNGKPEIITTVSEPRFELEVTGDEIKHDFFAVKPVVKTASGEMVPEVDMSEWTKVQTGPEMIILLLISLLI
jgi:hypothetical protein